MKTDSPAVALKQRQSFQPADDSSRQSAAPCQETLPASRPSSAAALPSVRKARVMLARLLPHELEEQVEAHLEQPYPVPSMFYVLDKVGRLAARYPRGLDESTLASWVAAAVPETRQIVQLVLARAAREKLAVVSDKGGWTLTVLGERFVRTSKQARVALWRQNITCSLSEICVVMDLEDQHEFDVSRIQQQRQRAPGAGQKASRRKSKPPRCATWFPQPGQFNAAHLSN